MRKPILAAALAGLVLSLTAMTACSSASPAAARTHPSVAPTNAPADVSMSDDFESGSLHGWSSTAGTTVARDAAFSGRYGADVNVTRAPGYLTWSPPGPQAHGYVSLRAYVQVVSRGKGESVGLITVKNSTRVNNFDFFVTGDTQHFKWDLYRHNAQESTFTVELGRWYLVEAQVSFAGNSYTARVRIDGVDQGTISSTGMPVATARTLWLGSSSPKTHEQRYDDVSVEVGDGWMGWLDGVTR